MSLTREETNHLTSLQEQVPVLLAAAEKEYGMRDQKWALRPLAHFAGQPHIHVFEQSLELEIRIGTSSLKYFGMALFQLSHEIIHC